MKLFSVIAVILSFVSLHLFAIDFTVATYNCGCLSQHYDYKRAVCMQKLMQERYSAEPEFMFQHDKMQALALKMRFAEDPEVRREARDEWEQKKMKRIYKRATNPDLNALWSQKADEMISSFKVRPIEIRDQEVVDLIQCQINDLSGGSGIDETYVTMAKRTFRHSLKFDIICLQEADYLTSAMFPEQYDVLFSEDEHSRNGVAWNMERFDLVEALGEIKGARSLAVLLREKGTGQTVLVASGHPSGCNPYYMKKSSGKEPDSFKGDKQLEALVTYLEGQPADIKVIGMDANATSLHPRLDIARNEGYTLDYENFLEPTCTNPSALLNTRIDWIMIKTARNRATITNIPVLNVGLNSLNTNMSDHKPVAAAIRF